MALSLSWNQAVDAWSRRQDQWDGGMAPSLSWDQGDSMAVVVMGSGGRCMVPSLRSMGWRHGPVVVMGSGAG